MFLYYKELFHICHKLNKLKREKIRIPYLFIAIIPYLI